MRLTEFRLQNYKKIEDTGWVKCEDLMVFVGKNESGKTALLRGLSKLKPTDDAKYDPIKEFPHGRYTAEFKQQDWPAASGKFSLTKDEPAKLASVCEALAKTKAVVVTRYYSDRLAIEWSPGPPLPEVSANKWIELLQKLGGTLDGSVAPNGQGEKWKAIKDALRPFVDAQITAASQAGSELSADTVEQVRRHIVAQGTEQWAKDLLVPIAGELDAIHGGLVTLEAIDEAEEWVVENMPSFLFFADYEILDSAIFLPEFLERVHTGAPSTKTRVQHALFKYVGVDIAELSRLGQHQHEQAENGSVRRQIDELDIKANSASIAMTGKFRGWWLQGEHKFTYKFHGSYFRIWVSDEEDPADVELEELVSA